MTVDEAARQLEQAIHDSQVAFDCIGLGHIDRAHTATVTARVAINGAESILQHVLSDRTSGDAGVGGNAGAPRSLRSQQNPQTSDQLC